MTTTEEWRDIPSAPGYQASSLGRIRSVDRIVTRVQNGKLVAQRRKGRVLRPNRLPNGYLVAGAVKQSASKARAQYVHRMVCEAFHGAPPTPAHEVAHGNGIRDDNRPENVRWATRSENHLDKAAHGTMGRKLTAHQVAAIRSAEGSHRAVANLFGISKPHVSKIRRGEVWSHVQ